MRVVNLPTECLTDHARSFGILSSYPPTPCGLATFSAALASGLSVHGHAVNVVRVVEAGGQIAPSDRVIGELVNGSGRSVNASSDALNLSDVAIVQHEYGLYGGADGDEVLETLGRSPRSLDHDRPHDSDQSDISSAVGTQRCRRFGRPGRGDDGGRPGTSVSRTSKSTRARSRPSLTVLPSQLLAPRPTGSAAPPC